MILWKISTHYADMKVHPKHQDESFCQRLKINNCMEVELIRYDNDIELHRIYVMTLPDWYDEMTMWIKYLVLWLIMNTYHGDRYFYFVWRV